MLHTLRNRPFRLLVGGQLASNVGDGVYAVALPWYVLAHGGSALLLGSVLAAYGIPRTVLIAAGGHLADRFGPWTTMLAADCVRAVAVAAFAVCSFEAPARPAILVLIAVVLGAGEGVFIPGSFSIIPGLVAEADLQAANALSSAATQVSTLLGPVVGGALVATAGPGPAFVLDAASFAVSTLSLAMIRRSRPERPGADEDGPTKGVGQFVRRSRVLHLVLLTTIAANLGMGALGEVALPVLSRTGFHAGAGGYGVLIASLGLGALVGTVVTGHRPTPRRPAVVGSSLFVAEAVAFALVPIGGRLAIGVAALAVAGLCNGAGNLLTITAFQRWAPRRLLGRLMGVLMLCSFGVFPLSTWLGGVVVHTAGPAAVFWAAAAILAVAVGGSLAFRDWREFGSRDARTRDVGSRDVGSHALGSRNVGDQGSSTLRSSPVSLSRSDALSRSSLEESSSSTRV